MRVALFSWCISFSFLLAAISDHLQLKLNKRLVAVTFGAQFG